MQRTAARILALATWGASLWPLAIGGVFGLGLKCDDACSTPPGSWDEDPNAWQWDGLAALGAIAFVGAGVFAVCVWFGRRVVAAFALATAATATFVLFAALTSDWVEHLDRRSGPELLFLLVLIGAPFGALALARR